jgi:hypothetical protein
MRSQVDTKGLIRLAEEIQRECLALRVAVASSAFQPSRDELVDIRARATGVRKMADSISARMRHLIDS